MLRRLLRSSTSTAVCTAWLLAPAMLLAGAATAPHDLEAACPPPIEDPDSRRLVEAGFSEFPWSPGPVASDCETDRLPACPAPVVDEPSRR